MKTTDIGERSYRSTINEKAPITVEATGAHPQAVTVGITHS
jgi:hypothetical protein